jgi:hypothetical protein
MFDAQWLGQQFQAINQTQFAGYLSSFSITNKSNLLYRQTLMLISK